MKPILLALLCLSACESGGAGPTPKATVAAMEVSLTAADNLAMNYVGLPRCYSGGPALCSSTAKVATIKKTAQRAYDAVTAAQSAVDAGTATNATLTDARAALAAFQAAVPSGAEP